MLSGWYRLFQGASDAYLPERTNCAWGPDCMYGACSTQRGSLLTGPSHPAAGETVTRTLLFPWGPGWTSYSVTITSCSTFYVYLLPAISSPSWGDVAPGTAGCTAVGSEFRFCTTTVAPSVGSGSSSLAR